MKRYLFLFLFVIIIFTSCTLQITDTTSSMLVSDEVSKELFIDTISNSESSINETSSIDDMSEEESEPEQIEEEPKEFSIQLSFAGDCMIACLKNQTTSGSFNEYTDNHEPDYFLEKVRDIFEIDDFTLVNLENVLSDQKLTPIEKNYSPAFWFLAQTSNIDILTSSSVEAVSVANNHSNDYGKAGYNDTVETVENANILCGTASNTIYFEKEGFRIAFICTGMWSESYTNSIINRIHEAEGQSDYQVVFFHGGTEKIHEPESWKQRAARKLVDNGADLVIGGHPHVLQPREVYNGVEIIYSLGNFCYGGHRQPENRTIIYQMNLTIDKDTLTVTNSESNIIPCYVFTGNVNNYQPAIIEDEEIRQKVLDFMDGNADLPY